MLNLKFLNMETNAEYSFKDNEKTKSGGKRKISNSPVTFHIKMTEEQKVAKETILNSTITFLRGKPGTSKSTIACQVAIDRLIKNHVDKIIITRPIVPAGRDIGFLPGDAAEKIAPYTYPILEVMKKLRSKKEVEDWVKNGQIEFLPIQFARGHNFENCAVICDEFQNATYEDLMLITSRICANVWMIFTSDVNQIDIGNKKYSAAYFVESIKNLPGVSVVDLTENFRHPLALAIMEKVQEEVKTRKEGGE